MRSAAVATALHLLGWAVVIGWVTLRTRPDPDHACTIPDRLELHELTVVDEGGTRRLVLAADSLGARVVLTGDAGTVATLWTHGDRAELALVASTDEAASLSAGATLGGLVLQVPVAERAIVVNGITSR